MTVSRWRVYSREVIEKVAREVGTEDKDKLRKAISAAYPFGPREHYPYKIWLSEVRDFMNAADRRMAGKPAQPGMFKDIS